LSAEIPLLLRGEAALAACREPALENAAYWRGILAAGPGRWIDNIRAEAGLVVFGGGAWPVTWTDRAGGDAYPASLHSHYVAYPRAELHLIRGAWSRRGARVGFGLLDAWLRLARADRAVQWSSWLFSTNLHAAGTAAAAPEVTAQLVRLFPGHAIVVRNVDGFDDPALPERFAAAGYGLCTGRQIYFFDGRTREFLGRSVVKRDLKALAQLQHYRPVGADDLTEADVPRIAELYRRLYLEKHSRLNPAYNENFVRGALRDGWLAFRGLRHESGRLDGVYGSFEAGGVRSVPFIGYDTALPAEPGLYRMLVAMLLRDTAAAGRLLNYSSAAGEFKRLRGAVPAIEYNALFTRHLSAPRRAAFAVLRLLANGPGRRFLESAGV
jgi:hypothetical protein